MTAKRVTSSLSISVRSKNEEASRSQSIFSFISIANKWFFFERRSIENRRRRDRKEVHQSGQRMCIFIDISNIFLLYIHN